MRAAFYEVEITPPLGGDIPGYFAERLTETVKDRLYVKAAVFEGEETAAMVVIDAEALPAEFCNAVTKRAAEYTGIPAENIAVASNHTHYGIPIGDDVSKPDPNFMEVVTRLTADCVTLAWQRLRPCRLTYGIGRAEGLAFNRDIVLKDGTIATNPGKSMQEQFDRPFSGVDEDLPVLTVYDEEDRPMGALFTYALHQDTAGGKSYSGDFASEISHQLKKAMGPEFVSLFMIGCCGDINHIDFMNRTKTKNHRQIGQILAAEILNTMEQAAPVTADAVKVCRQEVSLLRRAIPPERLAEAGWVLEDPENRVGTDGMDRLYARLLTTLEERYRGMPQEELLPVHTMLLGDVWLFAVPGELYHQFGKRMKAGAPGGKWLISEEANYRAGYLAVPELFDTGCYTTKQRPGSRFEPAGGDKLVDAVLQLANQMK